MADDNEKAAGGRVGGGRSIGALPKIESPSLSPASVVPARSAAMTARATPVPMRPVSRLRRPRNAMFAAWGAAAVAVGVIAGMAMGAVLVAPERGVQANLAEHRAAQDAVERLATQQSAQHRVTQESLQTLSKDVAALKTKLAVVEKTAEATAEQVAAKSAERLAAAPEITGTIPAVTMVAAPLPPRRPAPLPVVRDWSIRYVRDGFVYVQGHGEIYLVQVGAPLPGLGPVREVRHRQGRWQVLTPKGIILSLREPH